MASKLPLPQAVAWILASTLLIPGLTFKLTRHYQKDKAERFFSSHYFLSRIIQTGPEKEALPTLYLAELLNLSADKPLTLGRFDRSRAQQALLGSPVIAEAEVRVIEPDTVYVDYQVRKPVAWLYDFDNAALDKERIPFPIKPFFTPKNLPEIVLGLQELEWRRRVEGREVELALKILEVVGPQPYVVKRIDTSRAYAESLGSREVVVTVYDCGYTRELHLATKEWEQGLGNYLELREKLPPEPQVIDLRLPQLGFLRSKV